MYIFIKHYNGRMIFSMDDQVDYATLLEELEGLLVQPFFQKMADYPKAFFDFKSRKITTDEWLALLKVLLAQECIVCGGFVGKEEEDIKTIRLIERHIHSGEEVIVDEDTLINGIVHQDARMRVYANLYVLSAIKGIVHLEKEDAMVSSPCFHKAVIYYQQQFLEMTSTTPTVISIENQHIVKKGL